MVRYRKIHNTYLSQLGFNRVGDSWIRIVSDVIQTFRLKSMVGSKCYTIDFGVFPLCMPINCCDMGAYSLNHFSSNPIVYDNGWKRWEKSPNTTDDCDDNIWTAFGKYLIPFFAQANSCEMALRSMIELDELFDRNRREVLQKASLPDCATPWQKRSLCAPEKYYMALKCKDYQYALSFLHNELLMCEDTICGNQSEYQPEIVIERHKERKAEALLHQTMLNEGNPGFFDQLLFENERISRENIEKAMNENK